MCTSFRLKNKPFHLGFQRLAGQRSPLASAQHLPIGRRRIGSRLLVCFARCVVRPRASRASRQSRLCAESTETRGAASGSVGRAGSRLTRGNSALLPLCGLHEGARDGARAAASRARDVESRIALRPSEFRASIHR